MNLRQKVKQAKKELKTLDDKYRSNSTWDIIQKFQARSKLEKIIDYKRKPSRHYHWNEECDIDWNRLTYIRVNADFEKLATLKSPNGKPLKRVVIDEFLDDVFKTKVYQYAVKVSKLETNDKSRRVDYVVFVSNDKTKSKRLHMERIYYQFEGDDKLYRHEKVNNE